MNARPLCSLSRIPNVKKRCSFHFYLHLPFVPKIFDAAAPCSRSSRSHPVAKSLATKASAAVPVPTSAKASLTELLKAKAFSAQK